MILGLFLVVAFAGVATADGLYFHLYRYRLHERPESRVEHALHTVNACLFVPQIYLFFCSVPAGAWLWLAIALCAATLALEIADVRCEGDSRLSLGGLTTGEYLMHFLMSGMRGGFVCAVLATRSLADLGAAASLAAPGLPARIIGWCLLVPAVAIAVLHVALMLSGRRVIAHRAAAVATARSSLA